MLKKKMEKFQIFTSYDLINCGKDVDSKKFTLFAKVIFTIYSIRYI